MRGPPFQFHHTIVPRSPGFAEEDSLWGVYRFKEGLGGQVVRTLGAWDYTPSPFLYRLYTNTLPRILDWMRRRGKRQTRQSISI